MSELKTHLVWKQVDRTDGHQEWQAGGLARFYKIVYTHNEPRGSHDTSRTSFYSLYLSNPEGLDKYISSFKEMDNAKKRAQEHLDQGK